MQLGAEELATLANFACAVNSHAEGQRMAAPLAPIGEQGALYDANARNRFYWTRCPACACVLLNAFRGIGDFVALYRDKKALHEYLICRRSLHSEARSCCGVT